MKAAEAHRLSEDVPFRIMKRTWPPVALSSDLTVGGLLSSYRLFDVDLIIARFATSILAAEDVCPQKGAHRWNQKTVFYKESAKVPFILKFKGTVRPGVSDRLVNTGVDLIPTLCGFAGLNQPKTMPGLNLMGTTVGKTYHDPRKYIVASNHMVQGAPIGGRIPRPRGRMVRTQRYKYCIYSEGIHRESLVDMMNDPGEMINLADQPHSQEIIRVHRRMLAQWGASLKIRFHYGLPLRAAQRNTWNLRILKCAHEHHRRNCPSRETQQHLLSDDLSIEIRSVQSA